VRPVPPPAAIVSTTPAPLTRKLTSLNPLSHSDTGIHIDLEHLDNPTYKNAMEVLLATKELRSYTPLSKQFMYSKLSSDKKFDVLNYFARSNSIRHLPNLINGVAKLERQGSAYWTARIEMLQLANEGATDRYQLCLDEKRNFWAFTLGIVSIATFPFAVMTGYFGMNFENMAGTYALFCIYHIC
jgi:Mg2+ and Co2+ transporter CorA